MRIGSLAVIAALAAGCGDQRSFDQRYSDSQNAIEERAERIERELANGVEEPEAEESGSAEER